ncbi:YbjQ family protein [Ottowia testudinis]|uniref:Heavy metal-binding domain-containing protein n=1 Tax=Ottowia testudinis TaxID=2816950 RepID=A0A975CIA4_9BURK|nr:heavy metal-binding domain-containing protein [Ottowia testudinis]QTD44699.1 heavy metal-binding domain-containing protein [Ottowia testudinis]
MEILLKLGVFLVLAVIGFWRGRRNELAHLKQIEEEEKALADVLIFASRRPPRLAHPMDPLLVCGSVVVGSDFFRLLIASLRKVVGGNYRSYENMLERARRHALVRMKQAARDQGARMIFNVRFSTSRISDSRRGAEAAQVEVLAYGTAYIPATGTVAQSRAQHRPNLAITEHESGQTDLMKNPASRWWVLGWFAGVFYCLGELVTDAFWQHAWRYIGGAPWALLLPAAGVLAVLLAVNGRRRQLGWGVTIFLTVLTAPVLAFTLYFGLLRINGATAFDAAPRTYVLQKDFSLKPQDGRGPTVRFDDYMDYWGMQKPGMTADVLIARGWLGFDQYDINSLRDRYRAYYQSRP